MKSKEEIHNDVYQTLKHLGGAYSIQHVINVLDSKGYLKRSVEPPLERNGTCPWCGSEGEPQNKEQFWLCEKCQMWWGHV